MHGNNLKLINLFVIKYKPKFLKRLIMKSMLKMLLSIAIGATISSVSFADNLSACPAVQSGHGTYYGGQGGQPAYINLCSMGDTNYSVAVTLTNGGSGNGVFYVGNKTATSFTVGGGGQGGQTFDWIAVHN